MPLRQLAVCAALILLVLAARPLVSLDAEPLTTSRLSWVTNGPVNAATTIGDRLYIGGEFTRVAPRTSALGGLFSVSPVTGAAVPGLPLVDGEIFDVEPDGAGGLYIGGRFNVVAGVTRPNLARILADGTVDPVFAPATAPGIGPVMSIARGTARLFLMGQETRPYAVDPTTGARIPYFPDTNFYPAKLLVAGTRLLAVYAERAIAFDQSTAATIWDTTVGLARPEFGAVIAGSRLVIGSTFHVNSGGPITTFKALTAIDVATGALDTSFPTIAISGDSSIHALAVAGTTVYAGGSFTSFGGAPRANLAAVDLTTGALTSWAPSTDGPVNTLAGLAGGVLAGGRFATASGLDRVNLALIDFAGAVTGWQSAASAFAVHTLEVAAADRVVVGGQFGVAGGAARRNLAAFDLSADALAAWAPTAAAPVFVMAASGDRVFASTVQGTAFTSFVYHNVALGAEDGMVLPWVPTPSLRNPFVVGATAEYVYVAETHIGLRRVDPTTGAVDPGWSVQTAGRVIIREPAIYVLGGADGLVVADLDSGALHPTQPAIAPIPTPGLPEPVPVFVGLHDADLDGSTLNFLSTDSPFGAVDTRSGRPTQRNYSVVATPQFGTASGIWQLAVADGQTVLAQTTHTFGDGVSAGRFGEPLWQPGLTMMSTPYGDRLLTTATDVVVLGVHGGPPAAYVQGLAVFSRQPATAPHALTWNAVGNVVTFAWQPPAAPPAGYILEVGSSPGATNLLSLPTGSASTSFTAAAPNGTFYVRVRSAGASGPGAVPSNEVAAVIGCTRAPAVPTALAAELTGSVVTLRWDAPILESPTGYLLEAGRSAGTSDVATIGLGPDTTTFAAAAPAGTYHVRVRATNACGRSVPSTEVFFTVGAADPLPAAPGPLTVTVDGTYRANVTVQWPAVPNAVGYILEAGTAPRLADILTARTATAALFAPNVPSGRYHVRVRAVGAAGVSAPSPEYIVLVP
jgi:hypothetical protein